MSAATASSTDADTVYVRLLDEGVEVWRPVPAERVSEGAYRLSDAPPPEDEAWTFQPGEVVVAERRAGRMDQPLIALARASDFDPASQAHVREAG